MGYVFSASEVVPLGHILGGEERRCGSSRSYHCSGLPHVYGSYALGWNLSQPNVDILGQANRCSREQ